MFTLVISRHNVFRDGAFYPYNVATELPDVQAERLWVEARLRTERQRNIKLGITEDIELTMERLMAAHHEERVMPVLMKNEREITMLTMEV